ncbi:MAG: lactonase family protein [Hyphomicrobiales bacterium]|nr:lactonase family protein [Hyphomicrobiales bacterium]
MSGSPTYVYVGNGETRTVNAFRLNGEGGELAPVGTYEVPGPTDPCFSFPLAVSPDKRFLFVVLRNQPWSVRTFAIDRATGRLEYLGHGPLADNTCYISTDKTGRFLLSASYQGNKLAVNRIGPDGIVQPAHQVIPTEPKSHSIMVDAANRFAISACLGGDIVYQWRFDAENGRLSPNDPAFIAVKGHSGPRHFIFDPTGTRVYLLNEHAVTIYVYDYDATTGRLAERQVVNALTPTPGDKIWATDIHITPDGRFLYAAERGSSTLAMLEVDPRDGTLTLIGHIVTEKQPRGFAIDRTGRFLYCTGQLSTRMSSYAIDARSGKLAKLADYPVGGNPNWVEIVAFS